MATESLTEQGPARPRRTITWQRVERMRLERFAVPFGVLLYALWATHITWPLLRDPGHTLLGTFGDQAGGIAQMREWIEAGRIPFLPGRIHDLAAPEGLTINWGVDLGNWPYLLPTWLLALVIGPLGAYSLVTWLGFVLNGLVMQVLATRLTGSQLAGLVAGFAFAFVPFVVINAGTHAQFAHAWPLVLIIWRTLEVAERPTRRNAVLAGLAAILAVGFTSYYILIGGMLLLTCMVLALVYAWRTGTFAPQLKIQVAVGAAMLFYVGVLAVLTLGGGGGALRSHPTSEFYTYAARVHDYFVPFGASKLFGAATAPYLQANEHGSNFSESTLYVGLVLLQLAVIALVAAFARWSPTRLRWAAVAALAIAVAGFYWSAPPKVGVAGVLVPTPSDVIQHVSSTWRVYSRVGIVAIIGVTLMAAVGVAAITRGRHMLVATLVAALALAAVAVDFYYRPGVTPLTASATPPVYRLLKTRPGGILAQYPLLPAGYGDSADLYWQDAAGHPQLTGYAEDGHADRRALTLYYVSHRRTVRGLASLGVRYIMVPSPAVAGTPDPGSPDWGVQKVGTGKYGAGTATVYRVTVTPDPGYAYVQAGAAPLDEGPAKDPGSWIVEPAGVVISVDTPQCKSPCRGELRVRLLSNGIARQAKLRAPGGTVLWTGTVGARKPVDVRVPLSVDGGRRMLTLTADPGPLSIQRFDPSNPDTRSVSLYVSRLRFVA
jgi:hypothetical protein